MVIWKENRWNGFSNVSTYENKLQNQEIETEEDLLSSKLNHSKDLETSNDLELEAVEPIISKPNETTQTLDENVDLDVEVGSNETELTEKDIKSKLKEFGEYDPKLDLSN